MWAWFDHMVRAVERYKADGGDRLAAALTYYGFLSLFPLLLLAISVLGFVLHGSPERQAEIFRSLTNALPGVGAAVADNLTAVQEHRRATGVVGLAGLLVTGMGGVAALRDSLRLVWHQTTDVGTVVVRKLRETATLVGLGTMLLVSFAVTALGSGLLSFLLQQVGVTGTASRWTLSGLSLLLGLATDTVLFLYLFTRLAVCDRPWRRLLRGAMFGAVGFSVLKIVGSVYVGRTTTRGAELYGTVGAVIGILVGLNLISRFLLFAAAWTVTAPGMQDVAPSGTAPENRGSGIAPDEHDARAGAGAGGGDGALGNRRPELAGRMRT